MHGKPESMVIILMLVGEGSGISGYDCGVVVRVPGYTSRGPGLIPGASRLSEK
jgi:hypothetical protein